VSHERTAPRQLLGTAITAGAGGEDVGRHAHRERDHQVVDSLVHEPAVLRRVAPRFAPPPSGGYG